MRGLADRFGVSTNLSCVLLGVLLFLAPGAQAQNRAVDTDGAVELQGVVEVPSLLAVLILVVASVLVALVVTLWVQRGEDKRQTLELRQRLAEQERELKQLRVACGEAGAEEKR